MLLPIASLLIFIGTYTPPKGESKGVYSLQFNPTTGELSTPVLAAKLSNPTFLALHPNGRVIYALSESDTVRGKPGGGATAFTLDPQTGQLTLQHALDRLHLSHELLHLRIILDALHARPHVGSRLVERGHHLIMIRHAFRRRFRRQRARAHAFLGRC